MKKKSSSRSAFFNLRVLIGLLIITTGLSLALFAANPFGRGASGTVSKAQQKYSPLTSSIDLSILPPGFDCSQVYALGIDRQENFRAGLIMKACGLEGDSAPAGGTSGSSAFSRLIQKLLPGPLFIGGSDVDVILPDGSFPKVTQSESMEWGGPNNTWVVNYNDSRTASSCYSGLSYSTDNGVTWHAGQPLCSGHGTNFGDPIVVYNANLGMWFAGDLATSCGGQGVGLWTSPNGVTWTAGACAYNTSGGDRQSMWVDNNASSPHYGRMYISLNDFAIGGGALRVVYSDNGTTWTPVTLNGGFIRDVQVTGDLQGSGRVYVASMNEGGGGFATRTNVMYRSTDGGATWANSPTGPAVPAPGRSLCTANSYFVCMFGTNNWRHMGWGEPAANGNFVSLNYAQHGTSGDLGDVYFVRSTDAGVTWGTPVKLNTDTGTALQWQPSMTATNAGVLFASWYDQREVNGGADLNCTAGSPTQNCYRRWGRLSLDNGATWQPDDMVGRALSPLPGQPDNTVQPNYQGDYDYHSSLGNMTIGGWTDGRVIISNQSQQDVFVNFVQGATPTASPSPTGTATASPSPTATATPTPCETSIIVNGGFETGSFPPWVIDGHTNDPVIATNFAHSGTHSAFAGGNPQAQTYCEENSNEPLGDSSFYQQFTVPAGSSLLSFYHKDCTNDSITFDWQDAYITNSSGTILQTIYHLCDTTDWTNVLVDMTPYAGQTVRIKFLVHQDGFNPPGDTTGQWIDDVALLGPCGTPSPTPTFTPTSTGTPSATPTATPTCTANWSAGPNLPTVLVRAVGVYFPADGNFYTMGGRTSDVAGSDFQHVLRYSPGSNTWTQMGVTLPDNTMNNMACGVLTLGGTPEIYCVGGSAAGQTTATARVFYYNPVTDTATTLTAGDNWPGNMGTILPGGFAETGNKMYILGGFN